MYEAKAAMLVLICTNENAKQSEMTLPQFPEWYNDRLLVLHLAPIFIFPLCICMWICAWVWTLERRCQWWPEEDVRFPGAGVTGGGESPDTGSRELLSQRSSPQQIFLKIKSRERILERRQSREHQERYPLPRCQVHCLIKCFAILSL